MAASSESFYNLKKLHVWFALSALSLLGVTVWMLLADHRREWKDYQRTDQDRVQPWLAEARTREPGGPRSQESQPRRRVLDLPLVDALSRPVSIRQIWLPELSLDYHFCHVARFDRCTTCHVGLERTEPACQTQQTLHMTLPAKEAAATLQDRYGLELASQGVLEPHLPTVGLVLPRTPAARAGLWAGDVLEKIDGHPVSNRDDAERRLLAASDTPLAMEVRRGLPHPFAAHPRLDLFVGSNSPHPMAQFGCTICHEGQGSGTAFAFASHTPNEPDQRRRWQREHGWFWNRDWDLPMRAKRFAESSCLRCHHDVTDLEPSPRFLDAPAPKLLEGYALVRRYGCFGCHEIRGVTESGERMGPDLRLEPTPGTERKVGPSLRDVGSRLTPEFVESWIAQPSRLRPSSRMPQFFAMYAHLDGQALLDAQRWEPVELRAVSAYLQAASQPTPPLDAPAEVTETPSPERGRRLFITQGCAACHRHADYPELTSVQGPDLTNLGAKYPTESGRRWLVSWIRNPARHSPRTRMPNMLLEPMRLDSQVSDPAADLAAYLLESSEAPTTARPGLVEADLDELALLHLSKTFPPKVAQRYLAEGIPEAMTDQVQGDARELLGAPSLDKKLRFVGRRTIRKRGCFGCHDIPGFEETPPIGPALSDWGRKEPTLLAFGKVHEFVAREKTEETFFHEALADQRREGFLWQKLRDPRSFDYRATQNKTFNEQLLMGRFAFTDAEREAIATFVLGLVAEPPAAAYVAQPPQQRQAVVEGRKILDRYGCAECHTLGLERWRIAYDPQSLEPPADAVNYTFLRPNLPATALAASTRTDRNGQGHADLLGMPRVDAAGELLADEDDEGNPLHFFTLWEPASLAGRVWPVGGAEVPVSATGLERRWAPWGGAFARRLFATVLAEARAAGSSAADVEAWGWVPPSLVHEGAAVQPAWLYAFLLRPTPIRPALSLRMPRFTLSTEEARKLVDYFAAVSEVESPYTAPASEAIAPMAVRREPAMRLLSDRTTYCAKCHLLGDYSPGGEVRTVLAPNLDQVGRRLRPDYVRRWLAQPRTVLPYTSMPVNFPPEGPPQGQDLLPGTSLEQLDAVSELLSNYEEYLKERVSVRKVMEGDK